MTSPRVSSTRLRTGLAGREELPPGALGGSVSGEHGVGIVKRGRQGWSPKTAALMTAVKDAFDPRGLMNPGKKI